jgi:hypothetical protein
MEHNIRNKKETPKWMRSKNVRDMLKISDSTLQNLRINGSIPAYRLGASWFYREDEIILALEEGSTKRKEGSK